MAPVFLVCVAAASRAFLVNKAVLYFLLPAWHAISLNPLYWEAFERQEWRWSLDVCVCFFLLICTYMCFCKNVCSHVGVCLGSGVDVGLWREGGSAAALTDFQAPPAEPQTPASPLCSPLQKLMPDSTQHPWNKHKLPLFSSTWLAVVVQDVW